MSWAVFRGTVTLFAELTFFVVNLLVRIIRWLWDLIIVKFQFILPLLLTILVSWYAAAVWREHHTSVIQTVDFYFCETGDVRLLVYETWHNNLDTIEAVQCVANTVFATGRIFTEEFLKLTILENPRRLIPLFKAIIKVIEGAIRALIAYLGNPFDYRFNFFLIWDGYLDIVDAIESIFQDVCTDLFPAFQFILNLFKREEICCALFHVVNAPLRLLPELRNLVLGDPENNFIRSLPGTAAITRELCAAALCAGDYFDAIVVDLQIVVFGDPITGNITNPLDPTQEGPPVDFGVGCVAARLFCLAGEYSILVSNTVIFFIRFTIDAILSGKGIRVDPSDRPILPGLGPGSGAGSYPVVGELLQIVGSLLGKLVEILSDLFEKLEWEPIWRVVYNEACRDSGGVWDPRLCDKPVASVDGDNDFDACDPDENPDGFGFTTVGGRSFYSALPGCGPQLAECAGYTIGLIDVCLGQSVRYGIIAIAKFAEFVVVLLETSEVRFGELLAGPLLDFLGSSRWDDYTSYGEFTTLVYNPDGTVNERAVKNEDLLDVHVNARDDQHEKGGRPYEQTALTCLIGQLLVGDCGTALADVANAAGHIILIPVLGAQELAWSDYEIDFGSNPLQSETRDDFNEFLLSLLCIITDRVILAADILAHFIGCFPGLEVLEDVLVTIIAVVKEIVDEVKYLIILTTELVATLSFWWIGLLFGDTSFLSGDTFVIFFEILFEWILELFDVLVDLLEGFINFLLFFWFPALFGQNTLMQDNPGPGTFTRCFAEFEDCICGITAQIFSDICLPWPIDKCVSDLFGDCGCFGEDATQNCDTTTVNTEARRRSTHGPRWNNNGTLPNSPFEYFAMMFNATVCGRVFEEFRHGKPADAGDVAVMQYLECLGAARESLYFSDKNPDMSYDWSMRPDLVRKTGANTTKGMGVVLVGELLNGLTFASDPNELLDRPEKNAQYLNISEELEKRGVNDTVALSVLRSVRGGIKNGSKAFWSFMTNTNNTKYSTYFEKNMTFAETAWAAGTTGLATTEIAIGKLVEANITAKLGASVTHALGTWSGRLSKVPDGAKQSVETRNQQRRSVDRAQEQRRAKRMEPGIFPRHITQWEVFKNNAYHAVMAAKGYFNYLFYRPPPFQLHDQYNETGEHNETAHFAVQHVYQLQDHRPDSCNKIVEYGCPSMIGQGCDDPTQFPIRFYENTPLCQYFFGLGAIFTCEGNLSTVAFFTSTFCEPNTLIDGFPVTKDIGDAGNDAHCFNVGILNATGCGGQPCTSNMCVLDCVACPLSQVLPDFQCQLLDRGMHRTREIIQNCLDKIGTAPLDPTLTPPFDPRAEEDNYVAPAITQRLGTDSCGDGIVQEELGEECDLGNFSSDPNRTNTDFPFGRNYPCSGCNGCFLEFCGNGFADCRPNSSEINPAVPCNTTMPIWCETGTVISGGSCPNSTNAPVNGLCCPTGSYNIGSECCRVVCDDGTEAIAGRCCTNTSFPIHSNRLCCENISNPTCIIPTAPAPGLCVNATPAVDFFTFDLGHEPFEGQVEECDGSRACSPGGVLGGSLPSPMDGALGGQATDSECIRLVCGDGRLVSDPICPAGRPPVCYGLIENDSPFLAPFELIELPLPFGSNSSDCQAGIDTLVMFRSRNYTIKDPSSQCMMVPAYCGQTKEFRKCSAAVAYKEECDDGNRVADDGCDSQCVAEICPDAYFSPGNTAGDAATLEFCALTGWQTLIDLIPSLDCTVQPKDGACDATSQFIDPTLPVCHPVIPELNCVRHLSAMRPGECFNDPANPDLLTAGIFGSELLNEHTGQAFQGSVQFNCRGRQKWLWVYQDKECRGNYYVDALLKDGCTTHCMYNVQDQSVIGNAFGSGDPLFLQEVTLPCPSYINHGLDIACVDNCYACGNNITEPGEQCDDGTVLPTVNPAEDACIACQKSCTCQPGKPCMGFCYGPDYATPQTAAFRVRQSTPANEWGRSDSAYGVPCNAQFESALLGEGLQGYSPCGEGNICIPKLCCGDNEQGTAAASVEEEYTFDSVFTYDYFKDLGIACDPFTAGTHWRDGTCCWTPLSYSRIEDFCELDNQFDDPLLDRFDICTVEEADSRLMGRANPACRFQGIPWPIGVKARLEVGSTDAVDFAPDDFIFKTKKQCDDSVDSTCRGCAQPRCQCQPGLRCVGRCIGGFWQGELCDANNATHCKIGTFDLGMGPEDLSHLDGLCVPEACCGDGSRQIVTSVDLTGALVETCGGVCESLGSRFAEMLTGAEISYRIMFNEAASVTADILEAARDGVPHYTGRFWDEAKNAFTPANCSSRPYDGRFLQRANISVFPLAGCIASQGEERLFIGDDCHPELDFKVTCDTVAQTWQALNCTTNAVLGSGNLTECVQIFVPMFSDYLYFNLNECIAPGDWNPPINDTSVPIYMNETGAYIPTYCPGGYWDGTGEIFAPPDTKGYGAGCIAVWPCTYCVPGRDQVGDYEQFVHDAKCLTIEDFNSDPHRACEPAFIQSLGLPSVNNIFDLANEFVDGLALTSCTGNLLDARKKCDWELWPGKEFRTPETSDNLNVNASYDAFRSVAMGAGFNQVITWQFEQGAYYPCLALFNISADEVDHPVCCTDPNCGLTLPRRPGEDANGTLTRPMLPAFGIGAARKRSLEPATKLLRPAGHKRGKLPTFSNTKWTDDQDRFLANTPEHNGVYDGYYKWVKEEQPTEEQIREYRKAHAKPTHQLEKREDPEPQSAEVVRPARRPLLNTEAKFVVHDRVRRQDPDAPIRTLAEGTPPKPDVITPLIFDLIDFVVDLFVDTAENAVDTLEEDIIGFLTCEGIDDPFDLDAEEICIIHYIRPFIPLICDLPGNFDCHLGIGLWRAVLYVGGGAIVLLVFGGWLLGPAFTGILMLAGLGLFATVFAWVAWGFSLWCLPITPECIPREIDTGLAYLNGTCIVWPEGFVTLPANGSCGKVGDECLRREFTNCAEHGFLDGLDSVVFLAEWLFPAAMQWFRNSIFFTVLTKFPIDGIAEYFTLTFQRWDYSTEPISERDLTCFFVLGWMFLPQLFLLALLLGILVFPLLELLVQTLRDIWLITLGFSMWVEGIAESCDPETIEDLL